MKNITATGRILFALPFGLFGINHFLMLDFYLGQLTSFIPGGGFTIILTGICMIAACVSIISKRMVTLASYLLAAMLFLFIVTIHIPNLVQQVNTEITLITMLKDVSLMGGSLMIAGMSMNEKPQ
jgi:putative oxidoreductase